MSQVTVKYRPRQSSSLKRFEWSDPRPYVVYVDDAIAKDKRGNERRFTTADAARKAFNQQQGE